MYFPQRQLRPQRGNSCSASYRSDTPNAHKQWPERGRRYGCAMRDSFALPRICVHLHLSGGRPAGRQRLCGDRGGWNDLCDPVRRGDLSVGSVILRDTQMRPLTALSSVGPCDGGPCRSVAYAQRLTPCPRPATKPLCKLTTVTFRSCRPSPARAGFPKLPLPSVSACRQRLAGNVCANWKTRA